jgi:DnaJ-class molecular chaperone
MGVNGMPDYYKTLGIGRDASQDEIKKAWRSLARKYHPDAQRGKSDAEKADAERRMKEINEAYSVIGDEQKRRKYDDMLNGGFGSYVGGGGTTPGNGANGSGWHWTSPDGSRVDVNGNVTDANWSDILRDMFGIDIDGMSGNGAKVGGSSQWSPFGTGFGNAAPSGSTYSPFGSTQGTKTAYRQPRADECTLSVPLSVAVSHGSVRVKTPSGKTVDLRMPRDVHDGSVIRMRGMGTSGTDLLVHVGIDVPAAYRLDGDDVIGSVPIRFDVAMLGGKVPVTLPSGKTIQMRVPKGTTAGKSFAFHGEGLGRDGRCVLKAVITVPSSIGHEAEGTLRELSKQL